MADRNGGGQKTEGGGPKVEDRGTNRIQARLLILWLAVAIVVWNGVYDMRMHDTVRGYLYQTALKEAALGGGVDMRTTLHRGLIDAIAFSTAWSLGILLAGLATMKALTGRS